MFENEHSNLKHLLILRRNIPLHYNDSLFITKLTFTFLKYKNIKFHPKPKFRISSFLSSLLTSSQLTSSSHHILSPSLIFEIFFPLSRIYKFITSIDSRALIFQLPQFRCLIIIT